MGFGSFFKGLGKIALKAAPVIAAPFTGGASMWALPLIGAGAGAAGAALDGKGLKGALLDGGIGAATGFGAGALKGAASAATAGTAAKAAGSNGMLGGLKNILTSDTMKGIGSAVAGAAPVLGGAAKGSRDARLEEQMLNARIYDTLVNAELAKNKLDLDRQQFSLQAPGIRAGQVGRAEMINGGVQDFKFGDASNGYQSSGGLAPSSFGPQFKEAAALMGQGHMDKLRSGETFADIKLPDAPKMEGPGFLENTLGGVAMGGSIIDAILRGVGSKPQVQPQRDYVAEAVNGANPDKRVFDRIRF